jgi:hypothetical protein
MTAKSIVFDFDFDSDSDAKHLLVNIEEAALKITKHLTNCHGYAIDETTHGYHLHLMFDEPESQRTRDWLWNTSKRCAVYFSDMPVDIRFNMASYISGFTTFRVSPRLHDHTKTNIRPAIKEYYERKPASYDAFVRRLYEALLIRHDATVLKKMGFKTQCCRCKTTFYYKYTKNAQPTNVPMCQACAAS